MSCMSRETVWVCALKGDEACHGRFLLIPGRGTRKSSVSTTTLRRPKSIIYLRTGRIDSIVHQNHQQSTTTTMASKTLSDVKNKDLLQTKGYINNAWVDAASGATFDVINPATLEKLATLPEMGVEEVDRAVEAAAAAFVSYKKTSARQRARWLRKWSDLCHENIDDLALIMTLENGKTLTEAKGEVVYAASFLEWFAGEAERVHGEVIPTANLNQRIVTIKQPLGVAACFAPWNFPAAVGKLPSEPMRLLMLTARA
jgi:delta 1-pyrroline-5-carboxylate dehydrogenase